MRFLSPFCVLFLAGFAIADELDDRVIRQVLEANRPPTPALGDDYFAKSKWTDAAKAYLDYLARVPDDPEGWYKLATSLAKSGRPAGAANALAQAFREGFTDGERAQTDANLEGLRKSPSWGATQKLIKSIPKVELDEVAVEGSALFTTLVRKPEGFDAAKAYGLVVILHGALDDADSYIRSVPGWPGKDLLIAAVNAPSLILTPGCPAGRKWVTKGGEAGQREQDLSIEYVVRAIGELKKRFKIDPARVTLLGVSQGSGIAALTAVRNPDLVTGLACLMRAPLGLDLSKLQGKRVLVAHSREDEKAPFAEAEKLFADLQKSGATAEFFPYSGGHKLVPDLLEGVGEWLHGKAIPEKVKAK